MREASVPVTMGSPRFRTAATAACSVTEAWFPPGAVLEPHTHDRAIFAVMLEGAFESAIAARRLECPAATVWTEPREERHANYVGRAGARVLVVQPDPARVELFEPFEALTGEVCAVRHAGIAADARRVVAELGVGDALSPLAIDALVIGMMAAAARVSPRPPHHEPPPAWLRRARELLHEGFRERLDVAGIAAEVGVHPSHLAHAFRRHFRASLGEYARALRLSWAVDRLVAGDEAVSAIAASAGYADQSHFTRECKKALGVGPARYRRLRRG